MDAKVLYAARQEIEQWRQVHTGPYSSCNPPLHSPLMKWSPSRMEYIKCNIDGAIFVERGLIQMSLIIRDHKGQFLAAKMVCDKGPVDAIVVEALSCRKALQWLKENGHHKVIVESDGLLLVSAVNSSACYLSPVGLVFNDCKELLQVIPDSSLIFTRRLRIA